MSELSTFRAFLLVTADCSLCTKSPSAERCRAQHTGLMFGFYTAHKSMLHATIASPRNITDI